MTGSDIKALEVVTDALKLDPAMKTRMDQYLIASEGILWLSLLIQKNSDYGSSVWDTPILADGLEPGMAIRVRMSDKIQRLANLWSCKQNAAAQVASESIEDTIRDLGAYCLLYLSGPAVGDQP